MPSVTLDYNSRYFYSFNFINTHFGTIHFCGLFRVPIHNDFFLVIFVQDYFFLGTSALPADQRGRSHSLYDEFKNAFQVRHSRYAMDPTPSVPSPKLFDLSGQNVLITGATRGNVLIAQTLFDHSPIPSSPFMQSNTFSDGPPILLIKA